MTGNPLNPAVELARCAYHLSSQAFKVAEKETPSERLLALQKLKAMVDVMCDKVYEANIAQVEAKRGAVQDAVTEMLGEL